MKIKVWLRVCGALPSGDLLVFAAEDPGQEPVRRRERHSRQCHAARMAGDHQEPSLRRLSPARLGSDAHDPCRLFDHKTSADAWVRRVQSGQSAPFMVNPLAEELGGEPFKYLAGWTDRTAHGELPRPRPPRPQGTDRNPVITEWDWARPDKCLDDLISSDKRQPTGNGNEKLDHPKRGSRHGLASEIRRHRSCDRQA